MKKYYCGRPARGAVLDVFQSFYDVLCTAGIPEEHCPLCLCPCHIRKQDQNNSTYYGALSQLTQTNWRQTQSCQSLQTPPSWVLRPHPGHQRRPALARSSWKSQTQTDETTFIRSYIGKVARAGRRYCLSGTVTSGDSPSFSRPDTISSTPTSFPGSPIWRDEQISNLNVANQVCNCQKRICWSTRNWTRRIGRFCNSAKVNRESPFLKHCVHTIIRTRNVTTYWSSRGR